MRRALVIGGRGYIGQRLTTRLLLEGWEVTSLTRRGRDNDREGLRKGLRVVEGDRGDKAVIREALKCEPDVVFDLIAYRPCESQDIVSIGAGRLGRLVHLSTVSVYREYPATGRASERTAVRFEGPEEGYGPDKAACERVLEGAAASARFPYVILRAAQLMGPADPCSRQGYLVKRILAAQPILHPGSEEGFLWLLFVDDLINGLVSAATAPVCGRAFHLAQEEAPSLRGHVEELARALGRNPPQICFLSADRLIELGFRVYGFAFSRTIGVPPDTEAAREALGWQCTPHGRAVAATLESLCDRSHAMGFTWPGRDTTQARLSGAHEWIHATQEARVLARIPTRPGPTAATVLSWLSDDPISPPRPRLVASEQWSSFLGGRPSMSHSGFATVPAPLVDRLEASGGTWSAVRERDEEASLDEALPDLVAAVELDRWIEGRCWIYTSCSPPKVPRYGFTSEPQQFDLVPLGEGLRVGSLPGQRLLLEVRCSEDAATLAQFLRGCQERGSLRVDDLRRWARLYIVGAASWLPPELKHVTRFRDPGGLTSRFSPERSAWRNRLFPSAWVLSHSVARLLCRAGFDGPASIKMGPPTREASGPSLQLPPSAALCCVGSRRVVADVADRRLIEVAPAIAEILAGPSGRIDCTPNPVGA
jgi:nucleoside-diphosphate-sugar epimerase